MVQRIALGPAVFSSCAMVEGWVCEYTVQKAQMISKEIQQYVVETESPQKLRFLV